MATLNGGQVLSWAVGGRERLYLSPTAEFSRDRAIRGGVPVLFPQFGGHGPGPRHGFARLQAWQPSGDLQPAGDTLALELEASAETLGAWPHRFKLRLQAQVGEDRLDLRLQVRNTGDDRFCFTVALHTYLAVTDIADVAILGLAGTPYLDATRAGARCVDPDPTLRFAGEVDRVYLGAPGELVVQDLAGRLVVRQTGFVDTVVWNPGPTVGGSLPDLPPGADRSFVCVEAAAVESPIWLDPGQSWNGGQTLIG